MEISYKRTYVIIICRSNTDIYSFKKSIQHSSLILNMKEPTSCIKILYERAKIYKNTAINIQKLLFNK